MAIPGVRNYVVMRTSFIIHPHIVLSSLTAVASASRYLERVNKFVLCIDILLL